MILGYSPLAAYALSGGIPEAAAAEITYGFVVGYSPLADSAIAFGIIQPSTTDLLETIELSYTFSSSAPDVTYVINPGLIVPPADSPILFFTGGAADMDADRLSLIPEVVFPGFMSDGVNIIIPLATLDCLDPADADAVTGDWREIARCVLKKMAAYYQSLSPSSGDVLWTARLRFRTFHSLPARHWPATSVDNCLADFKIKACPPVVVSE